MGLDYICSRHNVPYLYSPLFTRKLVAIINNSHILVCILTDLRLTNTKLSLLPVYDDDDDDDDNDDEMWLCLVVGGRLVSGSNLTISSVRVSDDGQYMCTVTDYSCTSQTFVTVNVVWGQSPFLPRLTLHQITDAKTFYVFKKNNSKRVFVLPTFCF